MSVLQFSHWQMVAFDLPNNFPNARVLIPIESRSFFSLAASFLEGCFVFLDATSNNLVARASKLKGIPFALKNFDYKDE